MRLWTFLLFSSGIISTLSAEPKAVTEQSAHFQITSFAGKAGTEQEAQFLEGLVSQYSQVLQISSSAVKVSVELFPTVKAYEASVLPLIGKTPSPPLALKFSDKKTMLLGVAQPGDESAWAFQTFLSWFWLAVPKAPAWLEEGLARYFWDISGKSPAWQFGQNRIFADELLKQWETQPTLAFLSKPTLTDAEKLSAWGLVTFLMNTPNPTYARAFGAYLANLTSPHPTPLTAVLPPQMLTQLSQDCWTWWKAHPGRTTLLQEAEKALKAGDGKTAEPFLAQALQLEKDGNTLYLAGLAAYERKVYPEAESFYLQAQKAWKDAPPGLLDYAIGLVLYQQQKWSLAKQHFEAAGKASEAYTKLTTPLLANLP